MINSNLRDTLLFRFEPDNGGGAGGAHTQTKQDNSSTQDGSTDSVDSGSDGEKKTFTREELASIVNAQSKQMLDDFKQNELADLLTKAKEDGKSEANMSAKQLAEKEADERLKKLEERERAADARDAKQAATSLMTEKKVPEALQTVLLASVAGMKPDEREQAVDSVVKAFGDALQAEVVERAKGKGTPAAGGGAETKVTKEQWDKMTYSEQMKIYQENPTLAQSLM